MKRTITLLTILFIPLLGSSQIIIDQSSYVNWQASADTIYHFSDTAVIPNLSEGASQSWDLSSLTYQAGTDIIDNRVGTSSDYPNATYFSALSYEFTNDFTYHASLWGNISANGIEYMGESMDHQAFGLGSITFNQNDSLIFPQQAMEYSSNEQLLAFPTTFNSNWNTNYHFFTDFNITLSFFSFDNSPGQRRIYVTTTNNVSGWGTMTVKNPKTGNTSEEVDVLQVKQTIVYKDSFYINGAPVSATLLGQLGIQQGMETSISAINYYRAGEVTPLVTIYYDDTFTHASNGFVHAKGVDDKISISEVEIASSINIFPNPVSGHTLNLKVSEALKGMVNYGIMDINGKTLSCGTIDLESTQSLNIDPSLPAGSYFLSIGEEGRAPFIKSFILK